MRITQKFGEKKYMKNPNKKQQSNNRPFYSDAILNFCPVDFCLKWTLYFVSTSKIMIGNQFSINFDFFLSSGADPRVVNIVN